MSEELNSVMRSRIDSWLNLLKSEDANIRYAACEELRVTAWLPEDARAALRAVTQDSNPDVADAARRALTAHKSNTDLASISAPGNTNSKALDEKKLAKAPYSWLRVSPLLTVVTFIIITNLDNAYSDYYKIALIATLGSALWHLILLIYVGNRDSEFVQWHGRQAFLLAGLRTATCLIFLVIDKISGNQGSLFYWVIPVLIVMWIVMSAWGYAPGRAGRVRSCELGGA